MRGKYAKVRWVNVKVKTGYIAELKAGDNNSLLGYVTDSDKLYFAAVYGDTPGELGTFKNKTLAKQAVEKHLAIVTID